MKNLRLMLLMLSLFGLKLGVACAQAGAPAKIVIAEQREPFVVGRPAKVCLTYQNTSGSDMFLEMSQSGYPAELRISLHSADGKAVSPRPQPPRLGCGPIILMGSELYVFKKDETISISYDLNEIFMVQEQGVYTLRISTAHRDLASRELTFATLDQVETKKVQDICTVSRSLAGLRRFRTQVECTLTVGRLGGHRKETWVTGVQHRMVIDQNLREVEYQVPEYSRLFYVPAYTRIGHVELDVLQRLWVILEKPDGRCLVVWDLLSGQAYTVVPWGRAPIEMGFTRASPGLIDGRTVIAGVPGKTKSSTTSVALTDTLRPLN